MFSSKEADKKVGSTNTTSKVITPGTVVARLLDLKLEVPPYDSNAYNLILHLETSPIGEGFQGMPIDKDMPELGNYEGQVGRVQSQQYSYSDYTSKEGKTTSKEDMIFRWMWNFAKEIGASDKLIANDVNGDSISEYVENAKEYLIDKDRWIHFSIGGSEYENKAGYTQHRLFLLKPEKGKISYQLYVEGDKPTKLIQFDENLHIKKKKPTESVDSFSGRDASNDLDLD